MFSVVPKRESIQIYTPNTVTVSHCVNESTRKPKAGVGGWVVTVSQPIGSSSCGHLKCSLYPRSAVTHLATWHTAASQSMWVSFCFVFLSATAGGLWNLSSLTRDQPRSRRQWKKEVLTTGPPGNSHQSPPCIERMIQGINKGPNGMCWEMELMKSSAGRGQWAWWEHDKAVTVAHLWLGKMVGLPKPLYSQMCSQGQSGKDDKENGDRCQSTMTHEASVRATGSTFSPLNFEP